ncbi:hypothetical protein RF11_11606 [Thelohanellus kitauei]|uniref:Uncharacterized protein n=1 Tax=Thelohanellus kitauei TaxID=669202 RepID=A0A0C2MWC9_THEKT|nr:hypothetical protein RF11_11606 [Thelohanellus kitauei]
MTIKSILYPIFIWNLIIEFINGEEKESMTQYSLSFGTINISVELNVNIDYLSSQQDIHSFKTADITKFNIELKELNIVFENKRTGSWLLIECFCDDLGTQFEIDGCRVLFRRSEGADIKNNYVGYTIKLNKDTKYTFSNHFMRFKVRENNEHMVMFNVYKLIITFAGYTKKYVWDMKEYIPRISNLHSTATIQGFEEYEGEYIDESDSSLLLPDGESSANTEAQVDVETDVDNEINGFDETEGNVETNDVKPMENINIGNDDDAHGHGEVMESDDTDGEVKKQDIHESEVHNELQSDVDSVEDIETNEHLDTQGSDEFPGGDVKEESLELSIKNGNETFIEPKEYYQDRRNWIWEFFKLNPSAFIFLLLSVVIISSLVYFILDKYRQTKPSKKDKWKR